MKDIKATVAKNIAALRQANGMTQIDLAEKLNYSDKAVSKWERAESLPDISVLVEISDLFSVSLDTLVRGECSKQNVEKSDKIFSKYNYGFIIGITGLLVWLIALLIFVITSLIIGEIGYLRLSFVYAVPVSMIVWLVFNSIWCNKRRNYLIISFLMWSILAAVQISTLLFGLHLWMIYLLGIPGQVIILLWSMIKNKSK